MDAQQAAQQDISKLVRQIEAAPTDWQAYVDLVNVLTVTENFAQAEELGLKSLGLFAAAPQALENLYYALGNVYYAAADFSQAQLFFSKISDAKLQHDATMMQAQSYYAQQKWQQALVFALTGTEQVPTDGAAWVLLGNIWLSLTDLTAAQKAFDQALDLDAADFTANFGRGVTATALGAPDNQWLIKADQIDHAKFNAQATRLDELLQLMKGPDHND
ncbi:MAG: hypothetical protein LBT80_03050 [Lactobacillaceae bacterium]|jgi:tetratricopeptide (TPR) repeat protein|nr:hypothetical protein [Lactobacillaceae bacterium]